MEQKTKNLVPGIQTFWANVLKTPNAPFHRFTAGDTNNVLSYGEVGRLVASAAEFLSSQGLKNGDCIAVLSWNGSEGDIVKLGAETLGICSVVIYPNYDAAQVNYILNDSGSKYLFAANAKEANKASGRTPIVLLEGAKRAPLGTRTYSAAGVELPTLKDVLVERSAERRLVYIAEQLHRAEAGGCEFCGISMETVKRIVYTSGSTGDPKGVPLTHLNYAWACWAVYEHGLEVEAFDTAFDFLPWAHIFGDFLHEVVMTRGASSFLCHPTPATVVKDGLQQAQPTAIAVVPAFLISAKEQVDSLGGFKGAIVRLAFHAKRQGWSAPFKTIAEKVLSEVRNKIFGGKIRLVMTGSAACPLELFEWCDQISVMLLEGYGLTEFMPLSLNTPAHRKIGSVGRPLHGMDLRIVPYKDEEDEDYTYVEKDGERYIVGEIQARAPNMFAGYLNKAEQTAASFTPGDVSEAASGKFKYPGKPWFRSGDLGYVDKDGYLWLFGGRMGRMFKLAGGKKVYPEVIETAMKCPEMDSVAIGKGMPWVGLMVIPGREFVAQLLADQAKLDPSVLDYANLAKSPKLISAINQAIERGNKKLQHWERVKSFGIVPVDPLKGGFLTGSQKVKAKLVEKTFPDLVATIFAEVRGASKPVIPPRNPQHRS